jgi:hypothetical protein
LNLETGVPHCGNPPIRSASGILATLLLKTGFYFFPIFGKKVFESPSSVPPIAGSRRARGRVCRSGDGMGGNRQDERRQAPSVRSSGVKIFMNFSEFGIIHKTCSVPRSGSNIASPQREVTPHVVVWVRGGREDSSERYSSFHLSLRNQRGFFRKKGACQNLTPPTNKRSQSSKILRIIVRSGALQKNQPERSDRLDYPCVRPAWAWTYGVKVPCI